MISVSAAPLPRITFPKELFLLGDISVQLSESHLGLVNRRDPFLLLSKDLLLLCAKSSQPLGLSHQKIPFLLFLEIERLYDGFYQIRGV